MKSQRCWSGRTVAALAAGFLLCMALPLTGFAAQEYATVLITNVPHVKQKTDFCGEACVEMVLKKIGFSMDQDYVFDKSGLDPILGRGCYTADLLKAMKGIGFDPGPVWHSFDSGDSTKQVESQWKEMHADLLKGIPSIVCTHFDDSPATTEHFRLVLGYDPKTDEVAYHDPALDEGSYLHMPRTKFLALWQLKAGSARSNVIRFRCKPVAITNAAPTVGFSPADYAQRVMEVKKTSGVKDFAVVVEPPFVVTGDGGVAAVREYAVRTVRWAASHLKQSYFRKDPDAIITIWLFKDKSSYEKNTLEFFNEQPTTPYGFYSDANDALIMNIATGGGTLVHEIVHPFIRANFPDCPAWLNEGLGSLYEQSSEKSGRIIGLTNWRLAGLKQEIAEKRLPSFTELLGTTSDEFYSSRRGDNYAQARYLCYYLQERDLLVSFYSEFMKNRTKDPSGINSLKKILGENDLNAFQSKWEKFVEKLTFP